MTPADKRIAELIERWLGSVDLHLKYVDLKQNEYDQLQAWPKHDRPTRWVLELARQKVLELKTQCESRVAMGDGKFAESLELMSFLANLVGSQHVQRFVPLANPQTKHAPPLAAPQPARPSDPEVTREMPRMTSGTETTREMPKLKAAPAPSPPKGAAEKGAAKPEVKKTAAHPTAPATTATASSPELEEKIVTDAIRLMRWGRRWHELAELIARIADRPSVSEIRRVLRTHRGTIEAQVEAEA